jgi:hypothetical protein
MAHEPLPEPPAPELIELVMAVARADARRDFERALAARNDDKKGRS